MINIKTVLMQKFPAIFEKYPQIVSQIVIFFLRTLLREDKINQFLEKNKKLEDFDFIESALEELNFTYKTSNKAKNSIPSTGRTIIIANHPLGALDALCLLKLVGEIRKDVKIVANDILLSIPNIKNLLLGLDITTKKNTIDDIKAIGAWLEKEGAVIIFPAGEVSRVRPNGVRDTKWQIGALKLAQKYNASITPVYIQAKNSMLFYIVSMFYKPLAMFLLPHEMFTKKGKSLEIVVGEPIGAKTLQESKLSKDIKLKLLKKHLYLIGSGKKGVFETQKNIASAEDKKNIRDEIYSSEYLGQTNDGKKIYLSDFEKNTPLLKEIGRLREISFRKVGEGTGMVRDIDEFDLYYRHIILWDEENLEIVGSYRLGQGREIMDTFGSDGFYTRTIFDYTEEFEKILPTSIELGRSFVQPKYWGTKALDYLWHGIGAYLTKYPWVKYMFGPVSISGSYPIDAQKAIVFVYTKHFGAKNLKVHSKNAFTLNGQDSEELSTVFTAETYEEDFKILKRYLKNFGLTVPTLYKHYSELCEKDGVQFLSFGVDKDFGGCTDGFIVVNTAKILLAKKQRYMGLLTVLEQN